MKQKLIYITGGTSGIGKCIFEHLSLDNKVKSFSRANGLDLLDKFSVSKFVHEIKTNKPNYLFLNSGIAHFGNFETIPLNMISDVMQVNVISNMQIISSLKSEIKSGLKIIATLSTAAFINGAEEAVYNASKKAFKEYIVSVNTELKYEGIDNKIFMFVPHKISGTKMTGGEMNETELNSIVKTLIDKIDNNEEMYVPKLNEIYARVFKEYIENPTKQGIDSIEYRKGRK